MSRFYFLKKYTLYIGDKIGNNFLKKSKVKKKSKTDVLDNQIFKLFDVKIKT